MNEQLHTENTEFSINARTVKFVLDTSSENDHGGQSMEEKKSQLETFFRILDDAKLENIYQSSVSEDGYWKDPKFQEGFQILEREILNRGIVDIESLNRLHERTVAHNVTVKNGEYIDMVTGKSSEEVLYDYSLMKFGSPSAIARFGRDVAQAFIAQLDNPEDSLLDLFLKMKEQGEYASLMVPGSRNVESSSAFIMDQAIARINIDLSLRGLPTIVYTKQPRLASNDANYATLSAEARASRPPVTKTILPGDEFYAPGMHVFFADDVKITGATSERVKQWSKKKGALSTHEIYTILVDPVVAYARPEIESALNQHVVSGKLDESVARILNEPGFKPVQRMMRLLLGKNNTGSLPSFLSSMVPDSVLMDVYIAAHGNDYARDQKYEASVDHVKRELCSRGMVDMHGRII